MRGLETRASDWWNDVMGIEEGAGVLVMVAEISRRCVLGRAASRAKREEECGVGERRRGIERKKESWLGQ